MTPKPHTCSSCLLADTPGCTGFMPTPEGKGLIPLLIVGEALGEHEAKDSLPFRPYADSGSLLERALRSVGIQREQIAITNLIHCRPPGNLLAGQYYEEPAVQHCRQYLDAEVARFKPKAILALGALPFKYLSGFTGRGKQAQDYTRGYPVESVWYPGTPVIGTYHPSYIRRGATELFPVIVHDLHKALMIARGRTKWDTVLDVSYQAGGVTELQWLHELFLRYPDRLIAYDLETRESSTTDEDAYDSLSLDAEIITVQFSWAPGTGMSVPWNEETKPWIQQILSLPNPRSGHNCFHRNTSVWMGDGSWKSIAAVQVGEQVRTSRTGEVWHTAPVTNILHTKDLRPWVEVKVDGAYNRGVGRWGNPGVVCTPDHEWILRDGTKVKAADLQPGSEIAVPKLGANDLIFGSLLGDGSVRPDQDQFRCSHTNKAYAYEKAVSLGYADKLKSRSYPGGYKEGTVAWEMTAPIAGYWRSMFYNPDGSRIWNVPISDAALAIWYCDDGCLTSDGAAKIAIHRYSEYRKAILNWSIREFGASSLQTNDDNLYIFTASSARFFERIKAFVPPAMYYKLPRSYQGFYNGWLREPQLQIGRVLSVTPLDKVDVNKYCLEVGGTHTFFTRAGLVSNCWLFDEPQLRAKGITLPQLSMDTMAKWHHLQPDLPANLQFVSSFYGIERPWKHEMAADFVRYGCVDVDSIQRIEAKINQDLAGLRYRNPATGELGISLLEGYNQYVVPLRPILQRMEERGIPRDAEATAELVKYIDAEKERLDAEIQDSCPDAIKPTQSWTSWPLDLSEARKTWAEANLVTPISEKTGKPLKPRVPVVKLEDAYNIDDLVIAIGEAGYSWKPNGKELYKRLPFLANSTEHLKSYLRHYGIKIPTDLANDETTGRTELDKLMKRLKLITEATGVSKVAPATWTASFTARATRDNFEQLKEAAAAVYEFLGNVLTYRKLHKAKATYITGEGWTPNPVTGRIHTTFTLSATATLQLSSRKPNVQNIPKGKNPKDVVGTMLGKLLRKTVKAKPGHVIVECVVPKTRILKRDLTWAPAGDLKVGDELLGFDEYPVTAPSRKDPSVNSKRPGRYLRSSTITNVSRLIKECLIITTDKGQVTCSKDHSWLVAATSGPCVWKQAENLKPGDAISYFTDPWTVENSYDAGWLAGFLDGEGYAVGSSRGAGRGMGFGQNPGPVLDKVLRLLKERGFETSRDGGENGKLCEKYRITGQPFAWLRLIGKVRPERLLPKAHKTVEGMAYWGGNSSPAKIISIRNGGAREVVAMETTTHTFIAEGMLSHNCDYSGCHLVTMGLEAEDPNYIRIARIDGHSFLAAHMANTTLKSGRPEDLYSSEGVKLVYNDLLSEFESDVITPVDQKALLIKAQQRFIYDCEQAFADLDRWLDYDDRILAAKLAWVKKNFKGLRNDKAKPALLGNQLGLGSRKLYSINDDSFKNEAEAKQVQAILGRLFPKISAYQQRTRKLAQQQGYLISPYGSIRRFFEVERYDVRSQGLAPGMDAEKAGAFFVQTNAQGKLREAMIELEEEGWNERCNLINQVHDSLVYEMPIELCTEAIPAIAAIMERPAKRLKHPTICPEGLVLMCEASIGLDWGSIEEVKITNGRVEAWPESVRGLIS